MTVTTTRRLKNKMRVEHSKKPDAAPDGTADKAGEAHDWPEHMSTDNHYVIQKRRSIGTPIRHLIDDVEEWCCKHSPVL